MYSTNNNVKHDFYFWVLDVIPHLLLSEKQNVENDHNFFQWNFDIRIFSPIRKQMNLHLFVCKKKKQIKKSIKTYEPKFAFVYNMII